MKRSLLNHLTAALEELKWIKPHFYLRILLAGMLLYIWSYLVSVIPVGFFASPGATFRAFARMVAESWRTARVAPSRQEPFRRKIRLFVWRYGALPIDRRLPLSGDRVR